MSPLPTWLRAPLVLVGYLIGRSIGAGISAVDRCVGVLLR